MAEHRAQSDGRAGGIVGVLISAHSSESDFLGSIPPRMYLAKYKYCLGGGLIETVVIGILPLRLLPDSSWRSLEVMVISAIPVYVLYDSKFTPRASLFHRMILTSISSHPS